MGYAPGSFTLTHVPHELILLTLVSTVVLVGGCAGSTTTIFSANVVPKTSPHYAGQGSRAEQVLKTPALLSFDNQTGTLEYWPVQPGGSQNPIAISSRLGVASEYGLAFGDSGLAIASYSPPELVTYIFRTQTETIYPDPVGPPIDIAEAKGGTIYMLNPASVTAYPLDRSAFRTLSCQYVNNAVAIAVDVEGDIYVNGYGPGSFMGVVEFPYPPRSQTCTILSLNPELGRAAGIGIDPNTDNLIVLDDPSSCVGSTDGRMTVYRKPYGPDTGVVTDLSGTNCPGTFRLDATSQNMFVFDSAPSGVSLIDQLSYPGAQYEGSYSGSDPTGGFISLPNRLPN